MHSPNSLDIDNEEEIIELISLLPAALDEELKELLKIELRLLAMPDRGRKRKTMADPF